MVRGRRQGNIENNYDPDKTFQDKFNKETYRIQNQVFCRSMRRGVPKAPPFL